jgi:hypothetical protein
MPKPQFNSQDANILITLARSAPLENMAHAEQANATIKRFVDWYNSVQPKPKTVKPVAVPK